LQVHAIGRPLFENPVTHAQTRGPQARVHGHISEECGSNLTAVKMNYTNPLFCKNYIM